MHLCEDPTTGRRVSLKVADGPGDTASRQAVSREHTILERLDYPGLPRVIEAGTDPERSWYTYLHVPGKTLRRLEHAPDSASFDGVAKGLFGALLVLHDLGWMHYDISPDNLIVEDPRDWRTVTLIDLGHAGPAGRTLLGTPGWMAPEVLRGEPGGPESDIFSAGVVLIEYALGRRLFADLTQREILDTMEDTLAAVREDLVDAVGPERADLLLRTTAPLRGDRIGDAFEVLGALDSEPVIEAALRSLTRAVLPPITPDDRGRRALRAALLRLHFETGSAGALADRIHREVASEAFDLGRFLACVTHRGGIKRRARTFILCRLGDDCAAEGMEPERVAGALSDVDAGTRNALLALAATAEFGDPVAVARVGQRLGDPLPAVPGILRVDIDGPRFDPPAVAVLVRRTADEEKLSAARLRAVEILSHEPEERFLDAAAFLRLKSGETDHPLPLRRILHLVESGSVGAARRLADAAEEAIGDGPVPEALGVAIGWARVEEKAWEDARRVLARIGEPGSVALLLEATCALHEEGQLRYERGEPQVGDDPGVALGRYALEVQAATANGDAPAPREILAGIALRAGVEPPGPEEPPEAFVRATGSWAAGAPAVLRFSVLSLLNLAGRGLFSAGDREEAKALYLAAEETATRWGMIGRASVFSGNYANCLILEGETGQTTDVLQRIATDREERGDTLGAMLAWGNLGVVRYNHAEIDAALASWERQAALVREMGQERRLGSIRCRIACALQESGSWGSSRQAFESSIRIAVAAEDVETELRARLNYASLLVGEGEVARARREMEAAARLVADRDVPGGWRSLRDYLAARIETEYGEAVWDREETLAVIESGGTRVDARFPDLEPAERLEIGLRSAVLLDLDEDFRPAVARAELDDDTRPLLELLALRASLAGAHVDTDSLELGAHLPTGTMTSRLADRYFLFAETLVHLEAERGRSPGQLVQQVHEVAYRSGLPGLTWCTHLAVGLKHLRREAVADAAKDLGRALRGFRRCLVPGGSVLPPGLGRRREFRALDQGVRQLAKRVLDREEPNDPAEFSLDELEQLLTDSALGLAEEGKGGGKWERGIEKILSVTKTLNSTRQLDPLLSHVIESVLDLCDAEYGFVVLLDEHGAPSVRIARGGFADSAGDPGNLLSHTVLDRVLKERRSLLIQNAMDEEDLIDKPSVQLLSLQSVMCAPLLLHDRLLGAILTDNRTASGCFTPDDMRLLEIFASQAAIAIENSKLFEDLEASYRSLEEAQEKIVRSEKLKSLGVLAGGIAHDFNNLLTSILGNADMALRNMAPVSPGHRRIQEVKNAALLAADLCSQLLAYSGKGQAVVETLDLSALVRRISEMMRVSVPRKIALSYDLADDLPGVDADSTQIRQVFMNLLTNAAEACTGGEGVITIRTGVMDCGPEFFAGSHLVEDVAPGTYAYLQVADTGVGMTEEARRRLFEPFFTTKFTGRGLGLSAVLGIVRSHGGTIRVESAPERGSTITVFLPASRRTAQPERTPAPRGEGWRGSGTVLLVDDERIVLEVASEMLRELGFEVLTATDGREALELLATRPKAIDLVILDMNMPRMGGKEAFQEIRKLRPDIPVVISSGYSETDMSEIFAGRDVTAFMGKPYEFTTLLETMHSILG